MPSSGSHRLETTDATTIVITLPELVEHIRIHLHQSDLFSCVRVCRSWNQILTPVLWHTVDTRSRSWRDIIRRGHTATRPKGETKEWVKTIFAKHGHRIRHLTAHWSLVLEVAALSGKCTHLCSLVINNVEHYQASASSTTETTMATITRTTSAVLDATAETAAAAGNQELPWVSHRGMQNWDESLKHRQTVEHFWKLVQNNPGLARITLPCLGTMDDLSPAFVFDTLASLDHLQELDLVWTSFDVPTLLSAVPQLRRLRANSPKGLYSMTQDFASLRSLYLHANVEVSKLLQVLAHLSGLEELRVKEILPEPYTALCRSTPLSPKFPLIKSLHIDDTSIRKDRYVALLVEKLPSLVTIQMSSLLAQTQRALWKHCYYLDQIQSVNSWSVEAWRRRRIEDATGSQE